jgi:diguanylate cyclase (GGDEF)-like protein
MDVLLVGVEPVAQHAVHDALRTHRHRVLACADVSGAAGVLEDGAPAVLVLGNALIEPEAIDLCRRARSTAGGRAVIVIFAPPSEAAGLPRMVLAALTAIPAASSGPPAPPAAGAELAALLRATRAIMEDLDSEEVLRRIVDEAAQIAGTPHARVLLVDRVAGVLRMGASVGDLAPHDATVPLDASNSGRVVATGRALFVADTQSDAASPRAARYREHGIRTYLGLPITIRDEVAGVLCFHTTHPHEYPEDVLTYLGWFAGQAAIAIEHARLFREAREELAHRAFHDTLTGLPNRALFLDRLVQAVAAADQERAVAVMFLDLDHFKLVNDTRGHAAGDRVLIAVAERVRSCLRPGDTVARLGGDEFTVLLEGLRERESVIRIARRILAAVQAPMLMDEGEVVVTTSIGIAFSDAGATASDLLSSADAALYRAKSEGKNRHAVYQPGEAPAVASPDVSGMASPAPQRVTGT